MIQAYMVKGTIHNKHGLHINTRHKVLFLFTINNFAAIEAIFIHGSPCNTNA